MPSATVEMNLRGSSEDIKEGHVEKRDAWGHKAEFILASVGLAVGLGNIWRFPYLCQKNGGGAFLIPYIIFMVLEGLPLFFIEFAIGQRMRKTALKCWGQVHPALFGIGISCLMVSFMLCIYYVIVLAWCTYYFYMSFSSDLPWSKKKCVNYAPYHALETNLTWWKDSSKNNQSDPWVMSQIRVVQDKIDNFPDCCLHDAPMWYWYHKTLKVSPSIEDAGIGMNGQLAGCLLISWIVTYLCVVKGIKSSGKVVYFTAVFPYVVLIILFFRGVTLEGAGQGIKTFFNPDFSLLKDPQIWMDAATQMFFTLSLGFGALIAFASYMPERNNCMRDAYAVVLINCGTSVFAGIVVFSILGYRELKTGISATKVGSGPGLAFVTFSDAILLMEASPLWSVLFFFMLILLGIDSEFGTLEAAITPIYEMGWFNQVRKEVFTAICAVIMFLIGLCMVTGPGFYIFQIFDDFSVTLPLLLIAFFQVVAVSWVYGNDKFANDIEYMTGSRPNAFWLICWKYLSPAALLVVFVASIIKLVQKQPTYQAYVGCLQDPFTATHKGSKSWTDSFEYPGWGKLLVALVILVSILPVPIMLLKNWPRNWRQAIKRTFCSGATEYLPDPSWGDPSRRKSPSEMEAEMRSVSKAKIVEDVVST